MSSKTDTFGFRSYQFSVFCEIIEFNKLDEKIRDKWNFPDWPSTLDDYENWKNKHPKKYIGYLNDIKKLGLILKLPSDKLDSLFAYISRQAIPIHKNRIQTRIENNETTGEEELWIKINKTTSINDVKREWKSKIKPLKNQLNDTLTTPNDFILDKRVFELKKANKSTEEIIKIIRKEFNNIELDYKLINNACYRYKKIVTIDPEILSTF